MIPNNFSPPYVYDRSIPATDATAQHELIGSLVSLVITRVAFAIFESCYFQLLSLAVTSFLLTSLTKKILQKYISLKEIERVSVVILRKWPHLHIITGIVSSVLHSYAPLASAFLAVSIGISSALVFRVKWLSASSLAQHSLAQQRRL